MSLVDAGSRMLAVRPRPCKGWPWPPPTAAVGLDRACRPAFAAANHFDGGLRQMEKVLGIVRLCNPLCEREEGSWLVFEREPRAFSTIENKRYAAILWLDDHQLFL
jgi:hypothetical protein